MSMNVIKMLRICLVDAISASKNEMIARYNANEVSMMDFCQRAIDDTRRRLKELGHIELVTDEAWDFAKVLHIVRSILGNAPKMLDDLRDYPMPRANRAKLELWTAKWREENARSKRAKDYSGATSLPKRVRVAQDSGVPTGTSVSGTESLIRTLKNHMCGLLVSIPYDCISFGRKIGEGAYGSCTEATINSISFFPPSITYCAKEYKGASHEKIEQFSKEKNMQILNATLVRCIACTSMAPWVSIFPLYNGGTVHSMLFWLPFKNSTYRPVCERLERGIINFRLGPNFVPYDSELARVKAFVENLPHIIHALVEGMKDAHNVGFVHCDLHAKNVVLDFTRDNACRVGIIDWGLMLLEGQF